MFGHRALDLGVVDDRAVDVIIDGEELFAVDVDEEIVLAVEMERRRRIRRGHEQKSLDLFEACIARQASRLAQVPTPTDEQLMSLAAADVPLGRRRPAGESRCAALPGDQPAFAGE